MNIKTFNKIIFLPLVLLWVTYTLLGWYLSAHHIAWVVGAVASAVILMITGKGSPILKQVLWFSSQGLFVIVAVSLIFSLCAILFITDFQFVGLIFLPVITMFWADIEMRSAGFEPHQILLCLAAIAGLGIGLGEAIDILLIPSMRY